MKRLLSILLLAVVLPSGLLAWLALRSLRDQQFILERQQALLHQEIVDGLARDVNNLVLGWQADFTQTLRRLEAEHGESELPERFDQDIRASLPWAEVGFASESAAGQVLAPRLDRSKPNQDDNVSRFLHYNSGFLTNTAPALVFTSLTSPLSPPGNPPSAAPPAEADTNLGTASRGDDSSSQWRLQTRDGQLIFRLATDEERATDPFPESESATKVSAEPAIRQRILPARKQNDLQQEILDTAIRESVEAQQLPAQPEPAPAAAPAPAEKEPTLALQPALQAAEAEGTSTTFGAGADMTVASGASPSAKDGQPQGFEMLQESAAGSHAPAAAASSSPIGGIQLDLPGLESSASMDAPSDALDLQGVVAQTKYLEEARPQDQYQYNGPETPQDEAAFLDKAEESRPAPQKRSKTMTTYTGGRAGTAPRPAQAASEKLAPRRALTKKDFSEMQSAKADFANSVAQNQQEMLEAGKMAQVKPAEPPASAPAPATPAAVVAAPAELAKERELQKRPQELIQSPADKAVEEAPKPTQADHDARLEKSELETIVDELKSLDDTAKLKSAAEALPTDEKRPEPAPGSAPAGSEVGSYYVTTAPQDNVRMNVRNVSPQQLPAVLQQEAQTVSSVRAVESDFASVTEGAAEGCIARLENTGVSLLLWRRSERQPELIYGVQISGVKLLERVRDLVWVDEPLSREVCLALLDHGGKPIAKSSSGFNGNWRKPFVATEIGDILPYWEASLYLIDPQRLTHSAQTLRWTLGGMVSILVVVIALGAGFVSREVAQRMHEARQKTDFVSNVSHELKTPLTSIRMFSELLAENRVQDPGRQKQYLNIIVSEAGRLTRLINNVLDFARMERGEKRYRMESVELGSQLREVAGMLTPNLQEQGMRLQLDLPGESRFTVLADADALAQVWVNLISNAEKYANGGKEIFVRLEGGDTDAPAPKVRVTVEDQGPGVPRGLEKRIFEQFYRVDDSLAANVQGSGLGLTLARQIVEAHGGRIWYEPRPGGGSRFVVEMPLI